MKRIVWIGVVAVWGCLVIGAGPAAGSTAGLALERDTLDGAFDLVVVGEAVGGPAVQVALRTNPARGHTWTNLGRPARRSSDGTVAVWTDLSLPRYLGHDIRQNHMMLRIETGDNPSPDAAMRAVYAVPHSAETTDFVARLRALIRTDPLAVRQHSYAALVRPRPLALAPDMTVLTPIEAPVRHRKPGVLEVEWLELLYQNP